MKMLHATPAANVASIIRFGLLAARSKGAKRTVWVTTPGRRDWACKHCRNRHGNGPIALIEVSLTRGGLKKGGRHGMKHTGGRDVPPERIGEIQIVTTTTIRRAK